MTALHYGTFECASARGRHGAPLLLAVAAVRKRDHRRAGHDVVSALVRCPRFETHDAVSIVVDRLVDDAATEPDDVGEIDMGPILRT